MEKIVFDNIIYNIQKSGGISVYWNELIKRFLLDRDFSSSFIERKNSEQNFFRKELNIDESKIIRVKNNLLSRFYVRTKNEKTLFHSSYYTLPLNKKHKIITTVHDFIPEIVYNKKGAQYFLKKNAIYNSDSIITISQNTKNDLLNFFPNIQENKIHVVYNGISEKYRNEKKYDPEKSKYVLFVGSRATYKNFEFCLELLKDLKKINIKLMVVGSDFNSKEKELINSYGVNKDIIIENNPSTEKLNLIYNQAIALLHPSFYEGFGIPLVESIKTGCPVICLNNKINNEIGGNFVHKIDTLDKQKFKDIIESLIFNRDEYSNEKIKFIERYDWNKTFFQTKDIYKSIIK